MDPPPPPSPAAKRPRTEKKSQATGKAHGCAKVVGRTFGCKGCTKQYPIETMVSGWQISVTCKGAYDALYRCAKAQNELEWWSETKANPKLLKAAIEDYLLHCPPTQPGRGGVAWKMEGR